MAGQTFWLVAIVLIVAALGIGFYVGRAQAGGARQKASELEAEVERHKAELAAYRSEVDKHFDQTTSLFVSMAGSYKALFEHLNGGYEKLAGGEGRNMFRERIATLLMDGRQDEISRSLLEQNDDASSPHASAQGPVGDTPAAETEPAEPAKRSEPALSPAAPSAGTERKREAASDKDAVLAAAALGAVSPESADGDAAAVRDAAGVPVQNAARSETGKIDAQRGAEAAER